MIQDQGLIDAAIEQINIDIDNGDYTAIEELLKSVPEEKLRAFLSEEYKMPNWCQNGITIRHSDPRMIDRAINGSKGLLMEFIPTPQELVDTVSGFFGDTEKQRELEEKQQDNIEKYGHKDWYDWNIANWGTKWDVSLDNVERQDPNTVKASFESAWAPPTEAYAKLMTLGFEIEAFYYEPGMAFVGKWVNGMDDYVEYSGCDSKTVREAVGEELDNYFGISESMAEWEAECDE